MKLEFLPVYYPTEEELDDHHLYADNVRRIMARKLNLHSADYSMYDVLLQYNARKLGLPPLLCSVEWGYFADNFDLRMEFANGAMEIFADMNTTKDALLTLNQLYAGLLKLGIQVDYEDVADLLAGMLAWTSPCPTRAASVLCNPHAFRFQYVSRSRASTHLSAVSVLDL